ncbi:uncharacterized protein LOC111702948 [Eurytemora carolleeae]|uniref:uncharacterized protein LOC111702948 n=1 Tax=Eurytemora carolleeae TaxID=1294199 RepID=UPI000C7645C9|nr:uncharacterized protein LOC111702948 [Eurytemora carolleeae]|eukprot:XP_023330540.1 uncharacterized protein LOC111702948 [Eurytemora affinis]
MSSLRLILLLAAVLGTVSAENIQHSRNRNPRLFFASISSSTTTTTVTTAFRTATFCYTAAATATACSGRKKRSILTDPISEDRGEIIPSTQFKTPLSELESGDAIAKPSARDARLFLLLTSTSTISVTSTTTTTSFTGTTTISVLCIPAAISACG